MFGDASYRFRKGRWQSEEGSGGCTVLNGQAV